MRDRNYENQRSQAERDRRFGSGEPDREGFRSHRERERYGARDWREDEGAFGDDYENQGFEGRGPGPGGWREDPGSFGRYGQGRQSDPYRQRGPQDPYGGSYGQGFRRQPAREWDMPQRYGQGVDPRQEYGIDRNQGYGASQGYGSQRYGQGFEPESYGSQGYGSGQGQRGRFTGRGPKGWQRSDESVLERVNETLEQHPDIDASEIEVTITRGEIVLRGTVDDRRAKRLAEDAIENLPGVKDVRNEIRVQERQGQEQQDQQHAQQGHMPQHAGGTSGQYGRDNGGRSRSAG